MTKPKVTDGQAGLPVEHPTQSYWLQEPSEKLLGHRSTAQLPHATDVVIVGSGITGTFIAHSLKEQKPELNIVMLEAREACSGATGRNGGHCQSLLYTSAPHIAAFEMRTYLYIKSLVETYNIPCDWHSTIGVHGYYSESLFKLTSDVVRRIMKDHPELAVDMAIVTANEPHHPNWLLNEGQEKLTLNDLRIPNAIGAIVQRHAASLWPYKLVAFLLERLLTVSNESPIDGGFNLQTNTPVTKIQKITSPADSLDRSKSSKTSDVHGTTKDSWIVHTSRGQIATTSVLLATNGYTSHLLPHFTDLIVPTRGQVAALKPPYEPNSGGAPLEIANTYYFVGVEGDKGLGRDEYLIQRPSPTSELFLGGGRELALNSGIGVWDDSELEEVVQTWLKRDLYDVLDLDTSSRTHILSSDTEKKPCDATTKPSEKRVLNVAYEWAGIMGYSRDAHPWVGSVPSSLGGGEGLWVCAGYTGNGMPNAALCAKAVVDMMIGREDIDLPIEYIISEDRLKRARRRESVAVADEKGLLSLEYLA